MHRLAIHALDSKQPKAQLLLNDDPWLRKGESRAVRCERVFQTCGAFKAWKKESPCVAALQRGLEPWMQARPCSSLAVAGSVRALRCTEAA